MKKFFVVLLSCLTISILPACSDDVSQEEYQSLEDSLEQLQFQYDQLSYNYDSLKNDYASLQEEYASYKEEVDSNDSSELFTDSSSSEGSSDDTYEEITDGELFDSVSAVHSDVDLSAIEDTLYITINLTNSNVTDNTSLFFDVVNEICDTCHIEDFYSSISFTMSVDSDRIAMLTLLHYSSPTSFSSSYVAFDGEYEEVFDEQYEASFLSNDIVHAFESALDELGEKYGINP